MIFVWLATQSGVPEPQKWNDDNGNVVGGRPAIEPLAEHRLPADCEQLTLAQLARMYPPPTHAGEILSPYDDIGLPRTLLSKKEPK